MKKELSKHFEIETCIDGEEGLYLIEQGIYDLVILDLMLPNMDGMTIKQVGFEDLLNKTDSKSKKQKSDNKEVKTSSAKSSAKNTKTRKTTTKNPAANKKNSKTGSAAVTRKSSPKRVSLSQDDMDKLCEIYDWYLLVKDLAPLKKIKLSDKSTKIDLENDIVKGF